MHWSKMDPNFYQNYQIRHPINFYVLFNIQHFKLHHYLKAQPEIHSWTDIHTTYVLNCSLQCVLFTYIFMWYLECECNTTGTVQESNYCEKRTGACDNVPGCLTQYGGNDCGSCNNASSYYGSFPQCKRKYSSKTSDPSFI